MDWYTLRAKVSSEGVYQIQANSEEEAMIMLEQWTGGDEVYFKFYDEEVIEEIISVKRNEY